MMVCLYNNSQGPKIDTYTRRILGSLSCEQEERKKVQLVKQEGYTAMAARTMSYDASVYKHQQAVNLQALR
jgi:hypothetical protein